MRELIRKKFSIGLPMVAFSPPWCVKDTKVCFTADQGLKRGIVKITVSPALISQSVFPSEKVISFGKKQY
jgi:hypothetical protein